VARTCTARTCTAGQPAGRLAAVLSSQAAAPHGLPGRLIGRIWVRETAAVNDAALDLLDPRPHEHVLEIGFGPGRTIQRLTARAAAVTGVEVSSAMLAAAGRRNRGAVRRGRVRLLLGNGTTLPLPDHSVDAALAVHTLYFWPDPETTFREIARVLRPGGRLVLAFRDTTRPRPRRFDPRIYHLRSADTVSQLLHAAGLRDPHTHRYDAARPVTLLRARAAAPTPAHHTASG
jgi:ubiquinone/menaquinone biosynthesis C-methylase UbiE